MEEHQLSGIRETIVRTTTISDRGKAAKTVRKTTSPGVLCPMAGISNIINVILLGLINVSRCS